MLVGREAECAVLDRLLERALRGESGVLVLNGEPGIGKSALCAYALEQAGEMLRLEVRGVESESELPFAALFDLVRPVLGRLDSLPPPQAAALAGALALGPPAGGDRFAICAATLSLLAAASEGSPVLAVVDNAQWIDASSREALLFAARRLGTEGVVLLFAVREEQGAAFERAGLDQLELRGLDDGSAVELLQRSARKPIAPSVAEQLTRETGGNPLALTELPSILSEGQLAGTEPLDYPLPTGASIGQALLGRVSSLSEEAQQALLVAAASETGNLDAITDAFEGLAIGVEALALVEGLGLVRVEDARVEFGHPLLRSAIYQGASVAARRSAHAALAAVSSPGRPARAWHLAAAAPSIDEEVAAALEHAALEARQCGGHAEAAAALERAAELSSNDEERARRLLEAADDARIAGRAERALGLLERALAASAETRLDAEIRHLQGAVEMWRGAPLEAYALLVEAAPRVEPSDAGKAARMLTDAAWACFMAGAVRLGLETAERACAVAARAGGVAEVLATAARGIALVLNGEPQRALPLLAGYQELLAGKEEKPRRAYELLQPAGQVLTWFEEYRRARELLGPIVDGARAQSALSALPYALATLSEVDFRTGDWPAAYGEASEAVRIADETDQAAPLALALVTLARVEAVLGREEDCRAHVARALQVSASGLGSIVVYAGSTLGLLELALGRSEAAIGHLKEVARRVREHGLEHPGVIPWAPDLIEAQIRAGQTREAERELAIFSRQAERTEQSWARAAASRCRGLLAGEQEFAAVFDEAIAEHERTPTPFERGRTELCLGERLRRAGQRTDARDQLRSALEAFERLGAAPWAERARAELAASGEQLRRRDPSASERLTPQELSVALVVARGATNREAGANLFLSPKTIETHLGRIYRKLGVRSRTELARLLASEGALAETA